MRRGTPVTNSRRRAATTYEKTKIIESKTGKETSGAKSASAQAESNKTNGASRKSASGNAPEKAGVVASEKNAQSGAGEKTVTGDKK